MGNNVVTVTILAGESLSNSFRLLGYENLAIQLPAAWTDANITFQGCGENDGTFGNIYQDEPSSEISLAASAGVAISIENYIKTLKNFPYLKIRSGTVSVPVLQAANRIITIYLS